MHLIFIKTFITFGINDAIDILLVAIILYLAYNLVKGTSAINIFVGLAFIYFAYIVIKAFDLKLLSSSHWQICKPWCNCRDDCFSARNQKIFTLPGSNEFLFRNRNWKGLLKFNMNVNDVANIQLDCEMIVEACFNMSASKT